MQKFAEIPYTRIDFNKVQEKYKTLFERFENAADASVQEAVIYEVNNLKNEFFTSRNTSGIRFSIDASDKFYEDEKTFFDKTDPLFMDLETQFCKLLSTSVFRKQLEDKFGAQFLKIAEITSRTINSAIIPDMQEENVLTSQYHKLSASAELEFRGAKYNLAGLRLFEQDRDRATRKEAAEVSSKWFEANNEHLDNIYDNLVKIRTRAARKLGYKNFVDLAYAAMHRTDYNAADVARFRQQILEHVVPLSNQLRERQRKRLGLNKLKFYDVPLNYLSGNAAPKGPPDWIIENAGRMYKELSPETNEFFGFMNQYGFMDLENKKNKRIGGFCAYLPNYKAPFIFSNFNGTAHDITVLTHEAGHAFQYYQSRNNVLEEHKHATQEVAEIHSMSMELFTWPWMEPFFKEDTDKFKFSHLSSAIFFLPYGAAADEFQHLIYENPELTPAQRDEAWREIDGKYRPYLDYDGIEYLEKGTAWKRIMHIYCLPFYFIDYCLAQICALQFWSRAQKDRPAAWADYLDLCKAGGTKSFLELLQLANLNNPFKPETIQPIMEEVKKWLDGVDDAKL